MKKMKPELLLALAIGAAVAANGYLGTKIGKKQLKGILDRFSLSAHFPFAEDASEEDAYEEEAYEEDASEEEDGAGAEDAADGRDIFKGTGDIFEEE